MPIDMAFSQKTGHYQDTADTAWITWKCFTETN